jgi:AcrR family transcriptional regulator
LDQRIKRLERGQMQRHQTRQKLIDAACELFAASGNQPPSIDDIIGAAQVGRGSFYNHFASRDELFETVVNDMATAIHEAVAPTLAGIADPAERISVLYRRFIRSLVERPSRGIIFLRSAPSIHEVRNTSETYGEETVAEGVASGRFHFVDSDFWFDLSLGLTISALRRVLIMDQPVDHIDKTAMHLLVYLGLDPDEADAIAHKSLD